MEYRQLVTTCTYANLSQINAHHRTRILFSLQQHTTLETDLNQFFNPFLQELNKRQSQLESAHSILMRHHEQTRELEMRQQKSVHVLREEHLRRQHDTELTNQV